MDNCLFCKIIEGELPSEKVFDSYNVIAFKDVVPQAPTHILVVPKKHIPNMTSLSELDRETVAEMFNAVKVLVGENDIEESGFRVVINQGSDGGQTVDHLHMHILGGREMEWPPG
ncbi:MAG: histidine triad nucleotide-binding protein [Nitrospinota bacterium]|nr:histidine triad nucleotide-binding protein [Nitrospinota bacterium]